MRVLSWLPRHLALALACVVTLAASAGSAAAAVAYKFEFYDYAGFNTFEPFEVTVVLDDYVTETGLKPISSSLPTPFGYEVRTFGGNINRDFLFAESGGFIGDGNIGYSSTSFTFDPDRRTPNFSDTYITAPGVYLGFLSASTPQGGRFGQATLTVTEVPEPTTWALMILGFGAAGAALRQRRMAQA